MFKICMHKKFHTLTASYTNFRKLKDIVSAAPMFFLRILEQSTLTKYARLSNRPMYTVECGVSEDLKGNLCCVITPSVCLERLSKTTKLPQKHK